MTQTPASQAPPNLSQALRVLHVIASLSPRYGGPPQAAKDMCRALAQRGHQVELFTTDQDGRGVMAVPKGIPVDTDGYQVTYFRSWGPRVYRVAPSLMQALRRRVAEFDIVEIHGIYLFHTLAATTAARSSAVPYVIRPHGTLDRHTRSRHHLRKSIYHRLVEGRQLDGAAAIHYTSEQERLETEEIGVAAPGRVVPLGVDVDWYARAVSGETLEGSIPAGTPVVTFIGRLAEVKGLDILLRAVSAARRSGTQVHLVIAGPDDTGLASTLMALADELDLAGSITFTGMIGGDAKLALLRRSQGFVMASAHENFGIAAVEALAAGTPVILSPEVAIHREVAEAGAGYIAERTVAGMSHAIVSLLGDEGARLRMSRAARDLAVNLYSLEAMGATLERMYVSEIRGRECTALTGRRGSAAMPSGAPQDADGRRGEP